MSSPEPTDPDPIVLPAATKGLLSIEQVRLAYENDETLANWATELKMVDEEYASLAPNIRDMQSMLDRLKRNRALIRHRSICIKRKIRTRKKYLIQRLFDKVLQDVRRKLGVTQPNKVRLDNFAD